MKLTSYLRLRKPEGTDPVNVDDFNDNFDAIDAKMQEVAGMAGDLSNGTIFTTRAASRTDIASGDTLATIVGKVMKWFYDLKDAAFYSVANNDITTAEGYVADARIVKTHGDEIDSLTTRTSALETSFPAGCSTIAAAVTGGRDGNGTGGVTTASNASPSTIATNIQTMATNNYNAGVSATKKGTAAAAQVLTGYTFTNASGVALAGSMPNKGNSVTISTTASNSTAQAVTFSEAGYYTGVKINQKPAYDAGKGAYNGTATMVANESVINAGVATATRTPSSTEILVGISMSYSGTGSTSGMTDQSISATSGATRRMYISGSFAKGKIIVAIYEVPSGGTLTVKAHGQQDYGGGYAQIYKL